MAVGTDERSATAAPRRGGVPGARAGRERPVGGFELWTWLFMRISGLVLLFLAVGHVLIMHVLDEGIDRVNFDFVAVRWDEVFWRTWDWALLSLALVHGINGLRVVVQDYVRPAGARFAVNMFFYTLGFILFVLGTVVVFTFDPSQWAGAV
jgi:succinate dehydrogenase / fumarate reductase membrane anchor subunit